MRIRVLYFASLRRALALAAEEVELPPCDARVADLLAHLAARHPPLQAHLPMLLLSRNQEWCTPETLLADGDEVALMPPVSGG